MLSKTPLTFNYEEVTLKELDDLSSLEKVLFNEFIIASYSNMDSQRLSWAPHNADQIFRSLNSTFKNDIRWVIYSKGKLAGFWFITEKENKELTIEFYVSHGFEGGALDCFLSSFFCKLGQQTKNNVYVDLSNIPNKRVECFINADDYVNQDITHINCKDLKNEIDAPIFEQLLIQVKEYYV
jgi:hypothetical protein